MLEFMAKGSTNLQEIPIFILTNENVKCESQN